MTLISVKIPSDKVYVYIVVDESTGKYRFVNATKGHICKCQFDSVKDAIADLDEYVKNGKVLSYNIIIDEETDLNNKLYDDENKEV